MNWLNNIFIFFIFLIPGTIEAGINKEENCGNMGRTGVWMGLQKKRNLVYSSLIFTFCSWWLFNSCYLGYILIIGTSWLFYSDISKYINILFSEQ